ncbi:MAG: DUF3955 domain-containing protein [Lactimicrobium sp.]|uniref:DUF3955 domain-containing protein n=1 Tax=Lactimicrobium sp. TaxID=2563780 RepID=UPI002F35BCEB
MENLETKLVSNGSEKKTVKLNRMTMGIGAVLLVAGIVCFIAKAVTGSYVDSQGYLHEAFALLPIGYLLVAAGIVVIAAAAIAFGMEKHHRL